MSAMGTEDRKEAILSMVKAMWFDFNDNDEEVPAPSDDDVLMMNWSLKLVKPTLKTRLVIITAGVTAGHWSLLVVDRTSYEPGIIAYFDSLPNFDSGIFDDLKTRMIGFCISIISTIIRNYIFII